jgi:membrane protease YdiL (CAAX protease family)
MTLVSKQPQLKKHGRLFYFGIVSLILVAFVLFSAFVNAFSRTRNTVSIPLAFPVVAIIIFYEGVIKNRDLSGLGIKKENLWRNVRIGILVSLFGFFVMYGIVALVLPGLMQEISARAETVSDFFRVSFSYPLNYILQTIYAFALLAPAEELLFRGFIQGKLQKRMAPYLAILIQSILFGSLHGVPAYMAGLTAVHSAAFGLMGFVGGILLGTTFYKTGNNIVASWIAHALSDSPLALLIFGA